MSSNTKITSLNSNCLERIFKKLSLTDLINVSDTTKYFKPSVDAVFNSKYSKKRFIIYLYRGHFIDIREDSTAVRIKYLPNQLKCLRSFGHLISEIQVNYSYSKFVRVIEQYINHYCADSLNVIRFNCPEKATMKSIVRPFKKVHSIEFVQGELTQGSFNDQCPDLMKWFPNLQKLMFCYCKIDPSIAECIEKPFETLKKLTIINTVNQREQLRLNIVKFLHFNPQLYLVMKDHEILCELKSTSKITDLNDDCLGRIFKELKFVDLLSVADSMKCFKSAAISVFDKNFANQNLIMEVSGRSCTETIRMNTQIKKSNANDVNIVDQLQFLRCFGHKITKMHLNFDYLVKNKNFNSKANIVEQYINEYCGDSLIEMHFAGPKKAIMSDIQKPFKNVDSVTFDGRLFEGSFGEKVPNLKKWFPKLQQLSLRYCRMDRNVAKCIETKFDCLEKIILNVDTASNAAEFLRLNPNLKELELSSFNSIDEILGCIQIHPELEKLKLIGSGKGDWKKRLSGASLFEIDLYAVFTVDEVIEFVDECDLMKKFTFRIGTNKEMMELKRKLGNRWTIQSQHTISGKILATLERRNSDTVKEMIKTYSEICTNTSFTNLIKGFNTFSVCR